MKSCYRSQGRGTIRTDKYNKLADAHNLNSVYYSRIVRAVQVCSHEYLHRVATSDTDNVDGIEVPKFDAHALGPHARNVP